jgi:hypothetical protein
VGVNFAMSGLQFVSTFGALQAGRVSFLVLYSFSYAAFSVGVSFYMSGLQFLSTTGALQAGRVSYLYSVSYLIFSD